MTPAHFIQPDGDLNCEALDDGGTWLLDLVAAVDYLRRGHRPGFRVWDALEEAIRSSLLPEQAESIWRAVDPFAAGLRILLAPSDAESPPDVPDRVATTLQAAIRHWVHATAATYNHGHHWPHPSARRGFPPPLLDTLATTEPS